MKKSSNINELHFQVDLDTGIEDKFMKRISYINLIGKEATEKHMV